MNSNDTVLRDATLRESSLLRNVYLWMAAGLLLTGAVAYGVSQSAALLNYVVLNPFVMVAMFICQFAIVFALSAKVESMRTGTAIACFLAYSAITGLNFSTIFIAFTGYTITRAFISAAIVFVGAVLYGAFTRKSLRSWSSFLMMGLIGIIAVTLLNLIFRSTVADMLISVIGVVLFTGLTAFDSNKICDMNRRYGSSMTSEELTKISIIGALDLYLDLLNIFLYLLRLFARSDNR
ncbi:MAG: Bax inhibitor-1/YccA family protein [Candidatus Ornithospirochaeta sp.]|nr:Bax inhibitor-1/YccA family protein [Candidatus Ornithospirochaeta sp.]